jgi:hypothetical protein
MIPGIGLPACVRPAFLAVILAVSAPLAAAAPRATPAEAHVIAKEAYLYGYPMVENYRVLYAQAVDRGGSQFLAPINQITHTARAYTAADAPPMADLETAFSFAWLDLAARGRTCCTSTPEACPR